MTLPRHAAFEKARAPAAARAAADSAITPRSKPSAVRAQKTENFTRLNGEIDSGNGSELTELFKKIFDSDDFWHGRVF